MSLDPQVKGKIEDKPKDEKGKLNEKWSYECCEQPAVSDPVDKPGIGATIVAIKYDPGESASDTGTASKSYVIPRVSEIQSNLPSLSRGSLEPHKVDQLRDPEEIESRK